MEIRQLKYFAAVAEHLNFTEASRHLYVAQSAVSQQVAELENQLGVKLFWRNKRTVRLTSAGEVLLKETQFLLSRMEEAAEKTKRADSGLIGRLRIGFLGYTERFILPSLVRRFRHKYPHIDLELEQYHHGDLIERLNNEELDIGFTFSFGVESIGSLNRICVHHETMSVVLHEDHPAAQEEIINLADLATEPFVVLNRRESPQGYHQTLQICSTYGFSPNIVHEPRLLQTVLMLVDAGMGIAVLPTSAKLQASKSLRFIQLDEHQGSHELVVTWKKNTANPSINLFLEELAVEKPVE
ncbi:LysR family transcriptional regulator [Anoxynatronum buryatiense]|uniref:DNA-binding transcriptional regulator, LysR family n=1 Tax=Anoxynatronum buryatiense TaxID=489973 RepID=A0AA46AI37_9CLOT|nr:LysR family transcriptional regulator [Anoxynatronum buryatiense]SMP45744.1 DNA-binding transcriptional regulator, LysR family [Anoxynatronum buryatiense]